MKILEIESLLFEVAFDQCNFELHKTILAEGFDFYNDVTALNTNIENE